MEKRCLVIGLGVFGKSIASGLVSKGLEVTGVDIVEKPLRESKSFLNDQLKLLDASIEINLRPLEIASYDYCFVCIGANMEANILTTLHLNELGAKKIIGRSNSQAHEKILRKIGIYKIVSPEIDMGTQIVTDITSSIESYTPLGGGLVMFETPIPPKMIGKTLAGLSLRTKHRVNLLWTKKNPLFVDSEGISSTTQRDVETTPIDYVFNEYDIIILLGKQENISNFLNYFSAEDNIMKSNLKALKN